jgi:hypothetical protein
MHVCLALENSATPGHPVIAGAPQTIRATYLAD